MNDKQCVELMFDEIVVDVERGETCFWFCGRKIMTLSISQPLAPKDVIRIVGITGTAKATVSLT